MEVNQFNARHVHPCTTWARSAGHEGWEQALEAIRSGSVPVGNAPGGAKTSLGIAMLMEQVEKEGLHLYATEDGRLCIGYKENFPPSILEMQNRAEKRLANRLQQVSSL